MKNNKIKKIQYNIKKLTKSIYIDDRKNLKLKYYNNKSLKFNKITKNNNFSSNNNKFKFKIDKSKPINNYKNSNLKMIKNISSTNFKYIKNSKIYNIEINDYFKNKFFKKLNHSKTYFNEKQKVKFFKIKY